VWRVLSQAELGSKWNGKPSKKGTGFDQPLAAHQHWHIDVSYVNINGTLGAERRKSRGGRVGYSHGIAKAKAADSI
jgi:hypothetical protein